MKKYHFIWWKLDSLLVEVDFQRVLFLNTLSQRPQVNIHHVSLGVVSVFQIFTTPLAQGDAHCSLQSCMLQFVDIPRHLLRKQLLSFTSWWSHSRGPCEQLTDAWLWTVGGIGHTDIPQWVRAWAPGVFSCCIYLGHWRDIKSRSIYRLQWVWRDCWQRLKIPRVSLSARRLEQSEISDSSLVLCHRDTVKDTRHIYLFRFAFMA